MPTVPTPTAPTVGATDFTGQRLNAPQMRNFAPEQAQLMGAALERAGETGMAIATDLQRENNLAEAKQIVTGYTAQLHDLQFNPDRGSWGSRERWPSIATSIPSVQSMSS